MMRKGCSGERCKAVPRYTPVLLLGLFSIVLASLTAMVGGTALAAGNAQVAVGATLLSNSNCRFNPPNAAGALNFGNLDPGNPVDVTATATMQIRCGGTAPNATYIITDDNGLHAAGPGARRMQHSVTTTAFLPYSFGVVPASATIPRNTNTNITVTGTVLGASYQTALPGSYADTVTLTINP